jgi:SAM-dependent methyltransferase
MIIAKEEFLRAIQGSGEPRQWWAEGRSPELCRIFNVFCNTSGLSGPTLDIGSEGASFFRPLKVFAPHLLPYLTAGLDGTSIEIEGVTVEGFRFECDKDILPLQQHSCGLVLLCDVIEHLLVDPVWTLLEINRVLRVGGHLVVSTPNASAIERVFKILAGYHPGTEHEYKPTCIFARHNREWTISELGQTLKNLGFSIEAFDTNHRVLRECEVQMLEEMRARGVVSLPNEYFGPDCVVVAKKQTHMTLETPLPKETRWPEYLYTGYDCYRMRPAIFPRIE